MYRILLFALMFVTQYSVAQNAISSGDVINQLKLYKVSVNELALHAQPMPVDCSFEMEVKTFGEYPVTYVAVYNPATQPTWKMTQWNGSAPEKYQARVLDDRVARYATSVVAVDEQSLTAVKEGDYFIVSFRIKPETAPKEYMYLKDCDGKAYINHKTGILEKTTWVNFQPTKNQAVRVKKMSEVVEYSLVDGVYRVIKETQSMSGDITSKSGVVSGKASQIINYSNYRKLQ